MRERALRGESAAAMLALACAAGCGGDDRASPNRSHSDGRNAVPVLEHLRIEPQDPLPGRSVRASTRVRDPDGDEVALRYDWTVDGEVMAESGAELDLAWAEKGSVIQVVVVASDLFGESEPRRDEVTIGNRRPELEQVRIEPWGDVVAGAVLRISAQASDPDGDRIEYLYDWWVDGEAAPQRGASFSTSSLAPGAVVRARVTATDGDDESDPIDTAIVRIANGNPTISSEPTGIASDGAFRYRVEASDPEGSALRFSLRTSPPGMQIDPIDGEVTWWPGRHQIGRHPVEIEVADAAGAKTIQYFEISVGGGSIPAAMAPE